MLNHTNCITIFILFACLLSACESDWTNHSDSRHLQADTSILQMGGFDTTLKSSLWRDTGDLSLAGQDSYFLSRLVELESSGSDQAFLETLAKYKSLQFGALLTEGLESLFTGKKLLQLGRYAEAEQYLTHSLDCSLKRKQFAPASIATRLMSRLLKQQNRFKEALECHEQYVQLKDLVFNLEKQRLSANLVVLYEVRQKELRIIALQREHQLAMQRNGLAILMLLLSFGTVFYIYRKKTIRKAKKLAVENAQTEAHAYTLEQALEEQTNVLEEHRTRLNEYAKRLMERNREMFHGREHSSGLSPSEDSGNGTADYDESYPKTILTEADWVQFQQYFNKVHPGYISRLRQHLPGLTPAELRVILLGYLGLSLRETSAILGISVDAVKKGRYRLKKKYTLHTDDFPNIIPYP